MIRVDKLRKAEKSIAYKFSDKIPSLHSEYLDECFNLIDIELPKYYVRLQMAVAHGLGWQAGQPTSRSVILMLLPNTHSGISVQFQSRWSFDLL